MINTGMFPNVKPRSVCFRILCKIYHGFYSRRIVNINFFLFYRLVPALKPEYVAEEIVFGILTNKINVTLPDSANYILPLKK